MPLYEYFCDGCKKNMEILQKITEAPLKKCPECGGKLKKQISESVFHLKGSGWYKTDYASSASKTDTATKGGSKKPEAVEAQKTEKKKEKKED